MSRSSGFLPTNTAIAWAYCARETPRAIKLACVFASWVRALITSEGGVVPADPWFSTTRRYSVKAATVRCNKSMLASATRRSMTAVASAVCSERVALASVPALAWGGGPALFDRTPNGAPQIGRPAHRTLERTGRDRGAGTSADRHAAGSNGGGRRGAVSLGRRTRDPDGGEQGAARDLHFSERFLIIRVVLADGLIRHLNLRFEFVQ